MVRRIYETYKDSSPADTTAILRGITAKRGSQKLLGDESEPPKKGFPFTGKRRDISPTKNHGLAVSTYNPSAVEHMSGLLVPVLGLRFEPPVVGHAEFKGNGIASDIEGQIYVSEERVIANASLKFDKADWGKPIVAEAAEFIGSLGLAGYWERSLNLTFSGRKPESTIVFSGEQIDSLNNALVRYGELTKK